MRIACLLGKGFEDSEFEQPFEAFKKAGHEVTVIGIQGGEELRGDKGRVTTQTDKGIADVRPSEFDALFIPGGQSPDHIRINDSIVNFTRQMIEAGKPAFVICHGPQVLLTANCHRYFKLTAWPTIRGDLEKAGAKQVVDQEVVVDKNLVSSRKPQDIPAFIRESLAMLDARARDRNVA